MENVLYQFRCNKHSGEVVIGLTRENELKLYDIVNIKPDNFDIKNIDRNRSSMGSNKRDTLDGTITIDNNNIEDSDSNFKKSDNTARLTMDNIENQLNLKELINLLLLIYCETQENFMLW